MTSDKNTTMKAEHSKTIHFLWPAAMVLYVPCVALLLRPSLFEIRNMLIVIAWLVLWMLPFLFLKKKICYRLAVTLLFVGGLLNLIHWLLLKYPLNVSSLFVLLNTNGNEAAEFISLKASLRWLLLLPYLLLAVPSFLFVPDVPSRMPWLRIVCIALLLFVILFYSEAIWTGRLVRTALPDTERTLCSFSGEMKTYKQLKQRQIQTVETVSDTSSCLSVLIMGESCNRNHLSLYGYHRPTSPKLTKRNDILCFTDVITPYSITLNAILNSLTEKNMDYPVATDSCIHALDVYRSAGFTTYWLSNQSPIGVWDNAIFNFAKIADHPIFVNHAANSSFESTQLAVYDESLLPVLNHILKNDTAKRKWIVLHLMGSHSRYDKRYPALYAHFKGGKDKKQRTIDAYDNSILYNDALIDSIFSLLALYASSHPQTRVHAIYLSDHGENVYDEGENAGHDYADTIPYANVEIPFVLWLSRQDTLQDTAFYHQVQSRLSWPFMSDDLFHLLLDLDHIYTPCFKPERSLFHPSYQKERTRTLMDGRIYKGQYQ